MPKRKDSKTFMTIEPKHAPAPDDRLSIYETTIQLDEMGVIMKLDLQKDSRKMYFVLTDRETL